MISHDGNTIVTGNYPDDPPNYQCHVYVFKLINSVWTQMQKIANPEWSETGLGDEPSDAIFSQDNKYVVFGFKWGSIPENVATDGTWNSTGHVDIYEFVNNELVFNKRIIASDYTVGDYFGEFIAVNESFNELFISAKYRTDVDPTYRGAIYVFR